MRSGPFVRIKAKREEALKELKKIPPALINLSLTSISHCAYKKKVYNEASEITVKPTALNMFSSRVSCILSPRYFQLGNDIYKGCGGFSGRLKIIEKFIYHRVIPI